MNTAIERCEAIRKAVAEARKELDNPQGVAVGRQGYALLLAIEAIAAHVTYGQVPEQEKPHT